MKLEFQRSAGRNWLPTRSSPIEFDTSNMEPNEAANLERLVADSHFFDLPTICGMTGVVRQAFGYTITAQDNRRRRTVRVLDTASADGLSDLIEFLEVHSEPKD